MMAPVLCQFQTPPSAMAKLSEPSAKIAISYSPSLLRMICGPLAEVSGLTHDSIVRVVLMTSDALLGTET